MEIIDDNPKPESENNSGFEKYNHWHYKRSRTGRILGGLILVGVGAVLLANQLGAFLPSWIFTWPVLLIVIGIYVGARHEFRSFGWVIPVLIGGFFLYDEVNTGMNFHHFLWPAIIILIGIIMIIRPYRRHGWHGRHWNDYYSKQYSKDNSGEDMLDCVSVFGGVKKNIISKDFRGGEVINIFGGAEINLSQADIKGRVVLEVVQIFGGTKLIVPSHWEIRQEMVAVLGGIDDKRPLQNSNLSPDEKILVLKGTTIFGGMEIKSY
ncbi:MAG: LiaI-LiaF-like domain-containing protein [Bacteroidia bacterium]